MRPTTPGLGSPVLWGTVLLTLALDQLTKWWALERLGDGSIIDVVGSLRFRLTFNTGMSFSAGAGRGQLIGVVALVIVGAMVWLARSLDTRPQLVFVGMVMGGALGNVADRLFRADDGFMTGAVVDFIDLQWWPVFNIADAGIVMGGILLVISGFRAEGPTDDEPAPVADGERG